MKNLKYIVMTMLLALVAVAGSANAQSSGKATVFNTSTGEKLVINIGEAIPAGFRLMTNPVLITLINSTTGAKLVIQAGEKIPAGFVVFQPKAATTTTTAATTAVTTATTASTGTSLGDLIILDRLFNGNGVLGGGGLNIGGNNNGDLGDLFILNQLFGGGNNILNLGTSGITSGNKLGDLFVLDQLFGNSSVFNGGGNKSLGDLFVLGNLFGGSNGLFR